VLEGYIYYISTREGKELLMKAIEYRCPCCSLRAINLIREECFDVNLNNLTLEQRNRLDKEPMLAEHVTTKFTCPVSGISYNVFQLKRLEWEGTVDEFREKLGNLFLEQES